MCMRVYKIMYHEMMLQASRPQINYLLLLSKPSCFLYHHHSNITRYHHVTGRLFCWSLVKFIEFLRFTETFVMSSVYTSNEHRKLSICNLKLSLDKTNHRNILVQQEEDLT